MRRLKPLVALAVAVALALSVPVASVSAATHAPVARTASVGLVQARAAVPAAVDGIGPGSAICGLLAAQIQFAKGIGNPILLNLLGFVVTFMRCAG